MFLLTVDNRNEDKKHLTDILDKESIIDGCHVKLRFNPTGDNKIFSNIQSMLLSAYLDSTLTAQPGGESV